MRDNFQKSLDLVLQHEGGFVNHPADPGGATNKGITQAVYDAYRRNQGLSKQSVLHIRNDEVANIYRTQYWNAVRGDDLPAGVDYAVFDYAVNSGAKRAKEELQRTLGGVDVDGQIGDLTLAAVREACSEGTGEEDLILDYCARRTRFLKSLKTYATFGRGWMRRVNGERDGFQINDHGVVDLAILMARDDLTYPLPTVRQAEGKAQEADIATTKDPIKVGTIISTIGVSGQTVISAADQVKPHISEGIIGRAALVVFLALMVAGVALIAWTSYEKIRELKVSRT